MTQPLIEAFFDEPTSTISYLVGRPAKTVLSKFCHLSTDSSGTTSDFRVTSPADHYLSC